MSSTWLEVALNGPWGRTRRGDAPLSVADLVAEGVACVRAGAAIVHVHAYDAERGVQTDDAGLYAAIIEGIREQVDAIVYPTIPLARWPGDGVPDPAARFAHLEELARRSLIEWAVIDPGSVNISAFSDIAEDREGFVYLNSEAHIRAGLAVAQHYGISPSYALYEPGFLRLGAALARRHPGIGPPIYRFMFSDHYTFGFPPEPWALGAWLSLLRREAPGSAWMAAGLGVDIGPLVEQVVAAGGHIRVGLEDAPPDDPRGNAALVEAAARAVGRAGGTLAVPDQVRVALALTAAEPCAPAGERAAP